MNVMRLVLIAAAGCALLLAGCGSSGKKTGHEAAYEAGLNFSKCMRAHGLSNFPDPSGGGGGGIQIPLGSGLNPSSPVFQAAQKACGKDLPGPAGRGHASAKQKQQMLAMAQCMRAHGLANFPDPTSTAPQPGSGFGLAFGAPGSFLAIPQSMINSPGFNQAASACGLPGAGHLGAGKRGHASAVLKP